MLDDIYQDLILDHYKNPRCKGCIHHATCKASLYNPLCGDQIEVALNIENGRIKDISFDGHGCSISQAAASMMVSLCKDRTVEDVRELSSMFRSMIRGERSADECEALGDALALEGVKRYSARVKCAVLPWETLEKSLAG